MKVAVCIKQIPLVEEASFDFNTRTIRRDGPNVISAFDLRAIALAVELRNRFGAETVVATMGPSQARSALQDALAMGIDRGPSSGSRLWRVGHAGHCKPPGH